MATGNKGRTSGKKKAQTSRKTSGDRKGNSAAQQQEDFTKEVILWIVVAISILLFISNLGVGGTIGNAVSSFFFGIFGLIAYIFPVVLLVGTFFAISNKGNRIAVVKLIATILFVVFLCMFLELIVHGDMGYSAIDAYKYSFENKFGGGLIGGILVWLVCPNFGLIGSYVIDAIVLIIALVLITERSALRGVQKGGKRVYESAKISNERYKERAELRREERELRREEREQQREERELRRMDRKVEGVAIDTRIIPESPQIQSDEISEINAEQFLNFPEVKEEKHVTLTSGQSFQETMPTDEAAYTTEQPFAMEQPYTMEQPFVKEEPVNVSYAGTSISAEPEYHPDREMEYHMPAQSEYIMPTEQAYAAPVEPEYHASEEQAYTAPAEPEYHASAKPAEKVHKKEKQSEAEIADNISGIAEEIKDIMAQEKAYVFPPVTLLAQGAKKAGDSRQHLQETANKLQQTLKNFGVNVTITNISCGPAVTRYELQPEMGVKVSKIVNLADDIKLNLAATDIRIEAPIPGKAAIGIEVPNKENVMVTFRELIESEEFRSHESKISFCVGKDIAGKVTVTDIAKMPHLLIAGATGSGKSVCINTIIMSILYKADPKDVKLIMIDPKVVELSVYNGIPHLMIPVVTEPKKAAGALHWAVSEMDSRYQKFAEVGVRDLKGYNAKIDALPTIEGDPKPEKLPQIVIIVDELADLMMVAPGDVEEAICRLAQLARACGIHLIIATQRPSVNVITGLIKANMPSRIAFAVTSGVDSRTILDMNGAEKLLGKGDMLFNPQGVPKPLRVQGAFVSDKEVSDVVGFLKEHNGAGTYNTEVEDKMNSMESANNTISIDSGSGTGDGRDAYFADAARLLMEKEKGSIGMLQRYFKVGFNRAARIMDQLEEAGIVGPEEGTKPRKVLMSPEQFEQYEEEYL